MRRGGWSIVAGLACAAACGGRTPLALDDVTLVHGGDAGPVDATTLADAATDVATDADAAPEAAPPCNPDDAHYIFAADAKHLLHRFDPLTLTFEPVGTISCAEASEVYSMAVSRAGGAIVEYYDGVLVHASVSNALCDAPLGVAPDGVFPFGMAFTAHEGATGEALFVVGYDNKKLAIFNPSTLGYLSIGYVEATGMELSGGGDGRLFGFYKDRLVELDPTTAKTLSTTVLPGLSLGAGWAFARWGGKFWFFTAPQGFTQVTRYDPATQEQSVVATLDGGVIRGAGVSTCAPSE